MSKIEMDPVLRVIMNLIGLFVLILVLAFLFGGKTVLGFIMGLNLFGVHIVLYSIILSNSARNARNFN